MAEGGWQRAEGAGRTLRSSSFSLQAGRQMAVSEHSEHREGQRSECGEAGGRS
eukprot:SAG11_NODE_33311_length_278_cov_0.575419_1_plen_52_part_01